MRERVKGSAITLQWTDGGFVSDTGKEAERTSLVLRMVAAVAVVTLVLAGCAGRDPRSPSAPSPSAPETTGRATDAGGGVAPECDDVDRLVAEPAEEEPTGTTAEPARDGAVPDDAAPDQAAESDAPPRRTQEAPAGLHGEIERWGLTEAADSYAGVWVDHEIGGSVVAFARDVDRYAEEVRERFHPGLAIAEARHPYAELRGIQDELSRGRMGGDTDERGVIRFDGVDVMRNRATIGILDPTPDQLSELSRRYGATAICFEIEAAPAPPSKTVTVLAKAKRWRDGFNLDQAYAVLEIAYDRPTAERAWRENVGDDLEPRDRDLPASPGRYGDVDDVDFRRQVLAVWSSGESGSCPEWVVDVETDGTEVRVTTDATAETCTADYNPYRMVLAVDRDRLPPPEQVDEATLTAVPDGVVGAYPYGG